MTKIVRKVVFKQDNQDQLVLLPPNLGELIGSKDLVRVVNHFVEYLDLRSLIDLYEGGGTSSYHPRVLLKILLYGYCTKVYTGRRIARALKTDIHFMWLSGGNKPNFRTINNFRSGRTKQYIENIFEQMLVYLFEQGYIKFENYFCDGTPIIADANRHKVVWTKSSARYLETTKQKSADLFKQIDELNKEEDLQLGENDLSETGDQSKDDDDFEKMKTVVEQLNQKLDQISKPSVKRKAKSLARKGQENIDKQIKYKRQIEIGNGRSGYSKTDLDASAVMMKNKIEWLPGYNTLASTENQYLVNLTVHQSNNEASCFKHHFERIVQHSPKLPKNIVADSIYGTEENYELLEQNGIGNYMKYPSFFNETKPKIKNNPFIKENFKYDETTDTFTCPRDRKLVYEGQTNKITKTGYEYTVKNYKCTDCSDCPFNDQCLQKNAIRRTVQVNINLDRHRQIARNNLTSEEGKKKRSQRSTEIETYFGDIKHNMGFRRLHLRGLDKVQTELLLVGLAHNLRKMHINQAKTA